MKKCRFFRVFLTLTHFISYLHFFLNKIQPFAKIQDLGHLSN